MKPSTMSIAHKSEGGVAPAYKELTQMNAVCSQTTLVPGGLSFKAESERTFPHRVWCPTEPPTSSPLTADIALTGIQMRQTHIHDTIRETHRPLSDMTLHDT